MREFDEKCVLRYGIGKVDTHKTSEKRTSKSNEMLKSGATERGVTGYGSDWEETELKIGL